MESYEIQNVTTMRDYLKVIFRQKWVVLTAFLSVMIAVAIGLMLKTNIYTGEVKMLISAEKLAQAPYYTDLPMTGLRGADITLTQSEIVNSDPVIERTVAILGLNQKPFDYEKTFASFIKRPIIDFQAKKMAKDLSKLSDEQKGAYLFRMAVEELKKNIKVEPIRDTNLFKITVTDYSPYGSAFIANVLSRSYVIFDLEQQLAELQLKYGDKHQSVIQLRDFIDKMNNDLKNYKGEPIAPIEAIGPASVKIIEQAQVPLRPSGISKMVTMILAFFMSIFLGVMLAFFFEYMDQTFKSPQDMESFLNIPFLGYIPKVGPKRKHLVSASYQNLSEEIYVMLKDNKQKSILLTSALPKEGASTIIYNVAQYISDKAGHKVLVIDANLREPSIHKQFNLQNGIGLTEVLEDKSTFESASKSINSKLTVLSAGKINMNPLVLLGSHKMADLIKQAKEKFEVILIDCADMREYKDASILSTIVDGVALVVNEGKTRRQVIKAALEPLREKKANILGVILNNRTFPIPERIYRRV